MVKLYTARTVPVNSSDASVVLTKAQLWSALQLKIRRAQDFVPAMKECKVVKDENDVVLRECVLEQDGKRRYMTEEVTSLGQQTIIFRQLEGSVTTNLISYDPTGVSDTNMLLTYIFEWDFPDVEGLTKEYDEAMVGLNKMALTAVTASISQARELVGTGKIK